MDPAWPRGVHSQESTDCQLKSQRPNGPTIRLKLPCTLLTPLAVVNCREVRVIGMLSGREEVGLKTQPDSLTEWARGHLILGPIKEMI